jgi:hypothetical protein
MTMTTACSCPRELFGVESMGWIENLRQRRAERLAGIAAQSPRERRRNWIEAIVDFIAQFFSW